ncbi:hypothetical protein AB0K80_03525 [Streptomyces sp. NPDC052682]|uniref:hypothetical protein n=1 Tax=Streptomyces sp. NPDC052682 TaxID=3154954 RepID=UPI0034307EF1
MTQSGQGEEPSARPAREGIVLPSDGGEPLLPGMTGGPAAPPGGHGAGSRPGGQAPASPPGGQTWGGPWGPDQHQQQGQQQGQGWQSPPPQQQWGAQDSAPWATQDRPGPGPLPPEDAQPPAHGGQPSYSLHAYGPQGGSAGDPGPASGYGGQGYGSAQGGSAPTGQPGAGYGGQAYGSAQGGAGPLPPAADEGATQYLPPVPGGPAADQAATQYLPPVPAAPADEGATQYIPPVRAGALPPESPAETDSEATRYLGRVPRDGAGPLPPAGNPDAEATQYIAPVTDGHRQPPAGFENLFRSEPGGDGPAGATQQMPRVQQPQPAYGAPQPSYAPPGDGDGGGRGGRGGRSGSRVPVIAAVGIGIAVLGVGAGALLGSGGGGGDKGGNQPVSAASPAPSGSASPSADPVRQQAVELDKLLADSGASRTSVISAVADVKACRNLAQAAGDLRDAAKQRNELVTRLSGLTVDRLPDHAALTSALTKAWQASASADNHYAAWAGQVGGKKGCKKGQARITPEAQAGNRASGTASAQKARAAQLWNAIARKYGLTERQPTQL